MSFEKKVLITGASRTDQTTGEIHLRHHMTEDGFYKGKKVMEVKVKKEASESEEN